MSQLFAVKFEFPRFIFILTKNTKIVFVNIKVLNLLQFNFLFQKRMFGSVVGKAIGVKSIAKPVDAEVIDIGDHLTVIGKDVVFFGTKADIVGKISYIDFGDVSTVVKSLCLEICLLQFLDGFSF